MTNFDRKVIDALAVLRTIVQEDRSRVDVIAAVNTLDDAGVFAALDEQTDYAAAEDILAESAAMHLTGQLVTLDPAFYGPNTVVANRPEEWGDTTPLDMLRHQVLKPGQRLTQEMAEALFSGAGSDEDEESPTDVMFGSLKGAQDVHEHVFNSPHSDELCYATADCTMTYSEFRVLERCGCGRKAERSPALHAGTCPVWAVHHNLH